MPGVVSPEFAGRVAALGGRSLSPMPATLPLADVRRMNAIVGRLGLALRTSETLADLRRHCAALAADIQDGVIDPSGAEHAADTAPDTTREPQSHRPWDGDSAPATPRDSALGEEYGI